MLIFSSYQISMIVSQNELSISFLWNPMPALAMSSSQSIWLTVAITRSSISQINPNAIKSLIVFSILLDYTIIKMLVNSVSIPANNFIKATMNGKKDCFP